MLQAETSHLLDLAMHALDTQREIVLRERVSNASAALDRRHLAEGRALQDSQRFTSRLHDRLAHVLRDDVAVPLVAAEGQV